MQYRSNDMQRIKIENFERIHGKGSFVPFRHFSDEEATRLRDEVGKSLGLPAGRSPEEVVTKVRDKGVVVANANAEGANFDLLKLLQQLDLPVANTIFLNWRLFDDVDEIRTTDLIQHFNDIWYPSLDDLDLIDVRVRWLISVHHHGGVQSLIISK